MWTQMWLFVENTDVVIPILLRERRITAMWYMQWPKPAIKKIRHKLTHTSEQHLVDTAFQLHLFLQTTTVIGEINHVIDFGQ